MLLHLIASACLALQSGDSTEAAINRFGNELLRNRHTVGFAVGVIENGREYRNYFGTVRKGTEQTPDGKTMFQLASVTKCFTAGLLAHAVHEGVVNLGDPVSKYLPNVQMPQSGSPITLLDLADQSSGLPRVLNTQGRRSTSYEEMNAQLGTMRLSFEPGTGYLYSNLAYGVLSEALFKASKAKTWMEMVEKEVTRPIGMEDTTIFLTPEQKARVAQGYTKLGEETNLANPAFPAINGAGALYSDLDDMLKYLNYMIKGAKNGDPIVALMLQAHNSMKSPGHGVGLAWQIVPLPDGKAIVDKDGAHVGFVSYICFVKGGNVGLVFLANSRFSCLAPCKQLFSTLEKLPDFSGGEDEGGN
ncbi:MAG TPA: serine hydrolase [Fimbriimonadaceae bacterium]|jgi:D-alanyl-D-alanine-carboxypeptidase/D-alanyl-D-alanine-endopeptidase